MKSRLIEGKNKSCIICGEKANPPRLLVIFRDEPLIIKFCRSCSGQIELSILKNAFSKIKCVQKRKPQKIRRIRDAPTPDCPKRRG